MTATTQPIVWFGNEHLASGLVEVKSMILSALIEGDYDIVAVVLRDQGGEATQSEPIKDLAQQYNIPVFTPEKLSDIANDIIALRPVAGVLVAYGQMVPTMILDLFSRGIINIHPSLLPKYRGATPIEQALLDGETRTGVSLMRLAPEMDAGPVFDQKSIPVTATETKMSLATRLQKLGAKLLLENLDAILDGTMQSKSQDDTLASYCQLLHKTDGKIDFDLPTVIIERRIRALTPWPGAFFEFDQERIIILAANITEKTGLQPGRLYRENKQLLLGTSDGGLELTNIKIAGKKAISGLDYLNTHPDLPRL